MAFSGFAFDGREAKRSTTHCLWVYREYMQLYSYTVYYHRGLLSKTLIHGHNRGHFSERLQLLWFLRSRYIPK